MADEDRGSSNEPIEANGDSETAGASAPGSLTPRAHVTHDTTSWSIDWGGAISLAVIVVVVLLIWQQFGGDEPGAAGDSSPITTPSTTVAVASSTTSTAVTTTTTPPTTQPPTTAPTRVVLISGEVKPCQFGSECLVADFRIAGFDPHPGTFACIYPNSRSEFGFNDDDVDDACLSGDEGDTIAIEVDGVRSATISAENLRGESESSDG